MRLRKKNTKNHWEIIRLTQQLLVLSITTRKHGRNIISFVLLEILMKELSLIIYGVLKQKNVHNVSFLEYLRILDDDSNHHKVKPVNYDNWSMYTINNTVVVDFIGRYENLTDDMAKVCSVLNIPFSPNMFPQAKKK